MTEPDQYCSDSSEQFLTCSSRETLISGSGPDSVKTVAPDPWKNRSKLGTEAFSTPFVPTNGNVIESEGINEMSIHPVFPPAPNEIPDSNPTSVNWGSPKKTARFKSQGSLENISVEMSQSQSDHSSYQWMNSGKRTGNSNPLAPDIDDLILSLYQGSRFNEYVESLREILTVHFQAHRFSIAVPNDPTDIVSIPWGLKVLYNQDVDIASYTKHAAETNGFSSNIKADSDHESSVPSEDTSWHTDVEDELNLIESSNPLKSQTSPPSTRRNASNRLTTSTKPQNPISPKSSTFSWDKKLDEDFHLVIFNNLESLDYEDDCLIDPQGVVNLLENASPVTLKRHYGNSDHSYGDSEQAPTSPWSASPAPSPAIREYTNSPFFQKDELETSFNCSDGEEYDIPYNSDPIGAIGMENSYSLLHIPLVVPCTRSSPAASTSSQCSPRSAPVAILSIMSSIIPYPSNLRNLLNSLSPHFATAFVQSRRHSNVLSQLETVTAQLNSNKDLHSSHSYRKFIKEALIGRAVASDTTPINHHNKHKEDRNNDNETSENIATSQSQIKSSLLNLEHQSRFYSYVSDDYFPDGEVTRSNTLEISPPIKNARNTSSHKVRPRLKKLFYSRKGHNKSSSGTVSPRISNSSHNSEVYKTMGYPSSRLLRMLINAIPVHVFTADPISGEITWVSNRTLAFQGRTASEFCDCPADAIHEDERDEYDRVWADALRKGEPLGRMVQVRRFDGRFRAFFMRAVPLRDEKGAISQWFCTMMDIHKQRQAELEAIRHVKNTAGDHKYKILAESTPIIVFTTHPSKGMIYANKKWIEYSGKTLADSYGFQYLESVHPDDREKCNFANKNFNLNIRHSKQVRLLDSKKNYRWHLVTYTCSDLDDMESGLWFGTCTDIHDQMMIQEKLQEAKDAAQRTIESKTWFLSNMSHEIRTPLIGISGMVSFLLDTPLSAEQLDYCHTISSSSEALLMVINDILDLSKVESGKMTLEHGWFHVRRLVEEANELLSSMAISKNLELNYIIEKDVPSWVKGDRVRLRQVMLNIIGNAIKFTDSGEVFTSCRLGKTGDDGEGNNSKVFLHFEVHDTGRGFTEGDETRMFKPFSQVDGSAKFASPINSSGTGLGLVISRQLIQLHGGELTCVGFKDKGSTFYFSCLVGIASENDYPSSEQVRKDSASSREQTAEVVSNIPLHILIICPFKFACQSISHHIKATAEDPAQCNIEIVDGYTGAKELLNKSTKWTHVVINTNEVTEITRIVRRVISDFRLFQTSIVILTTSIQRSNILTGISAEEAKRCITFLFKPMRPSRYGLVFDPSKQREESHDMKMQNAKQILQNQKDLYKSMGQILQNGDHRVLLAEDNLVNQKVMSRFFFKTGLGCDIATDGEDCTQKLFAKEPGFYDLILVSSRKVVRHFLPKSCNLLTTV